MQRGIGLSPVDSHRVGAPCVEVLKCLGESGKVTSWVEGMVCLVLGYSFLNFFPQNSTTIFIIGFLCGDIG